MKICNKCNTRKDLTEFSKAKINKDGYKNSCKACCKLINKKLYVINKETILTRSRKWAKENPEKVKQAQNKWKSNNKDKVRIRTLKTYWPNLSGTEVLKAYNTLLNFQQNKCKICKRSSKYILNVDHCHKTGKVRGLLCNSCNKGLGHFEDSIEFLESSILYLRENNEN